MAITIFSEMKFLVILILAAEPIILPFNNALTCSQQGDMWLDINSTYYDSKNNDPKLQGNYNTNGELVFGYYCDKE